MWFDAVILVGLMFFAWRGAHKGVVWQLATIASVILCFAFAETLSLALAPMITVEPPLNRWIAMFILYIGFSFLSFSVARQLRGWIEKAEFVEFDQHLGAIVGLLKGAILGIVLTFFTVTLSESARHDVLDSYAGRAAGHILDRLQPVMPSELHDVLQPYLEYADVAILETDTDLLAQSEEEARALLHGRSPQTADEELQAEKERQLRESDSRLARLVGELIGAEDTELIQAAVVALRNTAAEDRDELLNVLATGEPSVVRLTIMQWQKGKPEHLKRTADSIPELLKKVSEIYFAHPRSQQVFIDEINTQIALLPDNVQRGILEDLYADLTHESADPDPGTDHTATFEMRITRQLQAYRAARTGSQPFN